MIFFLKMLKWLQETIFSRQASSLQSEYLTDEQFIGITKALRVGDLSVCVWETIFCSEQIGKTNCEL